MPETKKLFHSNGLKILTLLECGAIAALVLMGIALYYFNAITKEYTQLSTNIDRFIDTRPCVVDMLNASDFLTMQTILFIQTRNTTYLSGYTDLIEKKRWQAILDNIKKHLPDKGYNKFVANIELASERSKDLSDSELYAMRLAADAYGFSSKDIPPALAEITLKDGDRELNVAEKMRKARHIIFGADYLIRKKAINNYIHTALDELSSTIQVSINEGKNNLKSTMTVLHLITGFLFGLLLCLFLLTFLLISKPLKMHIKNMQDDRMLDLVGAYESQYLAHTYNMLYKQNKEMHEKMKFKIEHDALTKVCSRQAFEEQANMLKNADSPIAMLLIDVDTFKSINDTYGHKMGDTMLVRVATTLLHSFRSNDIVARIGGDEFAALLLHVSDKDKDSIGRAIDKINSTLQNPVNGEVATSLSVGVAFSPAGYTDTLKQRADAALYVVKEHGRCGYHVYEDGDEKGVVQEAAKQ